MTDAPSSPGMFGWAIRLRRLLEYPEVSDVPLDSPEMTILRRNLVKKNRAAHLSFERWYIELAALAATAPEGQRLELGSGGGFMEEFIPGLVKTDVVSLPFIDSVCRAEQLPFQTGSIGALLMVNVLHHIPDVDVFFREAQRVVKPGGLIAMIEPYVSTFSRFVYTRLHHEPFEPEMTDWYLPEQGRLSGGNDALPWIVLVRDSDRFSIAYPGLTIEHVRPHSFLTHMLSGGVTTRSLLPVPVLKALYLGELGLTPAMRRLALFATYLIRRTEAPQD
jgi:SAM-dependent methyltransferase